jgi:hypothetical protein
MQITASNHAQSGSVLIVAVILLLALTMIVLFGTRVGLFELRTSANDLRARMTHQVAEAGLNHGMEFVRLNAGLVNLESGQSPDLTLWELCPNDDTFPCGTVDAALGRTRMYRYIGGTDANGDGIVDAFERHMLPIPAAFGEVGSFDVEYGVAAVLCTLDVNSQCTTSAGSRTGRTAVTLVSRGQVVGDNARTTLTKTIGNYPLINAPSNLPPIVASGVVNGLGTSTIVGNPNGGGTGVPVSIWSRQPIAGDNGTWQSCLADTFFRNCNATLEGGAAICPVGSGSCDGGEISVGRGGNGGVPRYGYDILDPVKTRYDDREKVTYLPSDYFPCDLFEYVFDVRAREDPDNDGHCEGDKNNPGNRTAHIDEFLAANAVPITDCSGLGPFSSGLYWVRGGGCSLSGRVGSPNAPVVIVAEGNFGLTGGAQVFGLLFARNPSVYLDKTSPAAGYGWAAGGGNGQVYGTVVMEGNGTFNGTIDLIFSDVVMRNIRNSPAFVRFANVPGSWTDRHSY